MSISDETLMAYADGELDEAEAATVEAALAADPALQARLRPFSETRRLLGGMAGDDLSVQAADDAALIALIRAASGRQDESTLDQPVARGAPLAAMGFGAGEAIAVPQAANTNRKPWIAAAAVAACAVIALGWFGFSPDGGGLAPEQIAAIEGLPSGETSVLGDGRELTMIASYQQDAFCREYEITDDDVAEITIACREGEQWRQRFAVAVERPEIGGYTAVSEGLEALDAALAPLGEPLTPEAEAAALAR